MKITIGWKYALAFLTLNGVVSELHEQAHINVGRLISGCYGPRDFNVWQGCATGVPALPFAAPLAGPVFSYAVMWLGVLMLRAATPLRRALGFALVFAPLPFARMLTAATGGSDEKVFLLAVLGDAISPSAARWGAFAITLAACLPPVLQAWRALEHPRRSLVVLGLCVLPLPVIWLYKLTWLNGLLRGGLLDQVHLLGTPDLVLLVWVAMAAGVAATWRWLTAS
ncbi:hypothetical protein [Massilia sp. TS11]|uniref:hypothetical protein n=1 Tax=Massilia sp. TS11 TaxID=2908003 RepID=UPI001EDA8734|nr:hypothetical protein [Massilia sp. TS11]MCG2585817.1 hypothetical protein [Massilia sp. TS11]